MNQPEEQHEGSDASVRNPVAQLSADLSAVTLQMGGSSDTRSQEKPSLSQYFNKPSKSDSFFDQISQASADKNSAMMTSIRESPSGQDLLKQAMIGSENTPFPPSNLFTDESAGPRATAYFDSLFLPPGSSETSSNILVPAEFPPSSPPAADPFMPGTEADRRCNAWIPAKETRRILVDTVHEVVQHYLGEAEASKRKVLTAADVTQDDRGLRELIKAGCSRAAVNLTGRILSMYGQGAGRAGHPTKHTPHSIQLWFTRISLLVKLRSFSLAEVEAEPFGDLDRPDLYFQYYPDMHGSRQGTMVPFSFRLLLAELPQYLNKGREAMTRLHVMLAVVRKILSNLDAGLSEDGSPINLSDSDRSESRKLWQSREIRVLYSITNCAVYQKDFELAVGLVELLIAHEPSRNNVLHSALGRLFLMLGDVQAAEHHLALGGETDAKGYVDRGLAAVAQNAFQEAHDLFAKALAIEPSNILAVNNMAVCLLYMGRLKDALKILEGALLANPSVALHESVLLNICTLYELESSFCLEQKLSILKLIAQYKGDGIHMGCLKLQV
ncbi:hypothetical protein B566_EDAN015092 [Ephemera danica]|nr:hypothetical protein B566_EDAN015092 [Ephemera danica]